MSSAAAAANGGGLLPAVSLESKADLLLSDEDDSDAESVVLRSRPRWALLLRRCMLRSLAIACLVGRPFAEIVSYLYPRAFDVGGHERTRQSAMAYLALHTVRFSSLLAKLLPDCDRLQLVAATIVL